ncbi:DNA-3-methyladenine glycosylase 2 family protein [bacterium]|nr:DNA-3-methyladenine glycosylase 2 family protein [bacterium]
MNARAALAKLREADARLGRMIERIGPFRLKLEDMHSPFESLTEAIVYQQLTGKAAATILSRVLAIFPAKRFPSPDDILGSEDETLRGAGLSRAKVAAIKDLAAKTKDGVVPSLAALTALEDAAIIERLTQIRGIGPWTVEMLLIFRLGRPDILPASDYGVRKGFARAFGKRDLPTPKEVLARGERWRPFRTVASWYLWRASELA